jgi:penicillin-binding protein 1A
LTDWIRLTGRAAADTWSATLQVAEATVSRPIRIAAAIGGECLTLLVLAGLALLMLAQPAFRATGPGWLRRLDLAVTFVDRDGTEVGHRGIRHEDDLRLDELPPHLISAVLATEDHRFYRHWGVDPLGLIRALAVNAKADAVVQGGSTITQQLAKNVFLSSERTIERKINEAFLAIWLEHRLSKDQILKLYLDRAYMGAGAFGVQAASRYYFGKSARDLTLSEAATLAGLYKAPARYAPHLSLDAAQARKADVLERMVDTGSIPRAEAEAAKRDPLTLASGAPSHRPNHYLDWAFREVQRLAASGRLGKEAVLVVETPIDAALQRRAEQAVDDALDGPGRKMRASEAAFVALAPDGAVRALVGGHDYGRSQFNRATDALRQPGSSFKPIVYAAAVARTGLRPGSIVRDGEICIGKWCPANYSRSFVGHLPLASALASSLNTVAVRLSVEIGAAAGEMTVARQARYGRSRIIDLARDLGIRTRLHDTPSLPLGASEVTPLELTAAYASFANGGMKAEPYTVLRVHSRRGDLLYDRTREAESRRAPRVLSPGVVGDMNAMLARAVQAGTGRRAALQGQMVGGKTGTTSAYRDAWFIGFTSHLVGGIWMGNDDYKPTRQLTGGQLPAGLWHDIMGFAHRGLPYAALPETDGAESGERPRSGLIAEMRPVRGGRGFREVGGAIGGFTVAR